MANTDILFTVQDGSVFSNTLTLTVVSDDTFTVSSSGGDAVLLFSPDLTAAVSPQPQGLVALADGQGTAFTFTSSDAGGYFIAYGLAGLDIAMPFPPEISTTLHLQGSPVGDILPPPPPPPRVTTPPKGGTGPVLNPQGSDQ